MDEIDAAELSKRSPFARITLLISSSWAAFMLFLGIVAAAYSTYSSFDATHRASSSLDQSRYELGQLISKNAMDIFSIQSELRELIRQLPPSDERQRMARLVERISGPTAGLKAVGDTMMEQSTPPEKKTLNLLGAAYAATDSSRFTVVDARPYVFMAIIVILGLTFLGCIIALLTSTKREVLKFSLDTLRTLIGFFIGVATTFLGSAS